MDAIVEFPRGNLVVYVGDGVIQIRVGGVAVWVGTLAEWSYALARVQPFFPTLSPKAA